MTTIINGSLNIGSIVNDPFSTSSRTWADMVLMWEDYPGSWGNPQDLSNDSLHTASLSNNSYSE